MECSFHPAQEAVSSCDNCGKSMCQHCLEAAYPNDFGKTLCPECTKEYLNKVYRHLKSQNAKLIFLAILKTIIYAIGMGLIVYWHMMESANLLYVIIGMLICGFSGIGKGIKGARAEEDKTPVFHIFSDDNVHRDSNVIVYILYIMISVLVNVVATPFKILGMWIRVGTNNRQMKSAMNYYRNVEKLISAS